MCFINYLATSKITLKIGIFAGSNWNVPNGDCYQIIDQVIERFEKNIQWLMLNMKAEL
ncbi:hypothetical protein SD457_22035 [Coprobacillaceae bacterium CR2/5/TPMF4]|nr:hypothetical protein SD457_22035 [Coprobacillaceae bacterium CR2/5/TPMF4]